MWCLVHVERHDYLTPGESDVEFSLGVLLRYPAMMVVLDSLLKKWNVVSSTALRENSSGSNKFSNGSYSVSSSQG